VRVRTGKGKVTFTCLNCGNIKRIPYLKEKKIQSNIKIES
jgi:RNase P subunit RPR2